MTRVSWLKVNSKRARYTHHVALLTTDDFYIVTLKPFSNSAWTSMSPIPAVPAGLIDKILSSTTFPIYVIDASMGWFAFDTNGQAAGFDDTLVASSTGPMSKSAVTLGSKSLTFGKDGSNNVYVVDSNDVKLEDVSAGDSAALKALLP